MKIYKLPNLIVVLSLILAGACSYAYGEKEEQPAPRIERWEQTIKDFEALDKKTPAPKGEVLLIGGSNARRWTDVDDHFPKHRITNRGFGGARLTEILHFMDRIVLPYEPKIILVNAGGNDLNAGSSPKQVRQTAKSLIEAIRDKLPDSRIYFIGLPYVGRSYGRPEAQGMIDSFNSQLADLAEQEAKVGFINILPAFLGEEGAFQKDLFVEDGTHFSAKGYAILAELIGDRL